MKTKAELITFLKRFKVTKTQGKTMTEVIQVITELWDEKNMSVILQQISGWLTSLQQQHQDMYTNERSMQLTMRKWEELAKLKGWITQEDLIAASKVVSESIIAEREAARIAEEEAAKINAEEPCCDDGKDKE